MKNIRFALIVLFTLATTLQAIAQYNITGTVFDRKDGQALPGAQATLEAAGEKTIGTSTDLDGKFKLRAKKAGKYTVKVAYIGYASYTKVIEIEADTDLGKIRLKPEDKELDEVKVTGVMQRQEQRGDTTVFNADAFKVNPDATTEDLIKKMPGMQVEGSEVKSGGQKVKKVLVDGKEFFGDDPMMALKNISADMVSKIEVYDKQSDQSEFTGFNDGNDERTINILTKMGINSGRFGRVYAGYGTDNRYEAGGNLNMFYGDHRFTVLGLLNNINQQNFSFDDVTGAMANAGGRGMGGMFNWGQGGKNRTGSLGFNYNFEKKDKIRIEASYFYSNAKNVSNSVSSQEYFTVNEEDSLRMYESASNSTSRNYSHRANLRLTWTINDYNSIVFTPRVSWQNNKSNSNDFGIDTYDAHLFQQTTQDDNAQTKGMSLNGSLTWRHKFDLERRTLSLSVGGKYSDSDKNETANSKTQYADANSKRNINTSKQTSNYSVNNNINASLMYTEPFGENIALQINYSPSVRLNDGDKVVKSDTIGIDETVFNDEDFIFSPLLSNKKNSTYIQHKAGAGMNIFKGKEFNATLGLDYQYAQLKGEQIYPYAYNTDASFQSVLPSVRIRWRKDRNMNLRFDYRASTSAPSISQLQNVIDVSNIRRYSSGNPDLAQSLSHDFRFNFMRNNAETSRAIFVMLNYGTTRDYIATESFIASKDTVLYMKEGVTDTNGSSQSNAITVPAGTQYSKPVNLNGQYSFNSHITFSTPVQFIKSTMNLSAGFNTSKTPGRYNGRNTESKNSRVNGSVTISSNISENVDFTLGYNANYNIVKSTMTTQSDYNYYTHSAYFNLNTIFFTRLVFTNNLSHNLTTGMGEDYDNSYLTWNASLGLKFFKDRRAELRLRCNDILNNTQSVSRSIRDAYIQTASTDVLKRYFMLTFTYKFKQIGEMPTNPDVENGKRMMKMRGGMPPML